MKKVFLGILVVGAIGVAVFFYMTRPLEAPSQDIQSATESLEAGQEQEVLYRIDQSESLAEYNIDETLRGEDITVVGTTNELAGDILLNMEDPSASTVGMIKVNARTFETPEPRRDAAVGRTILESENEAYEFITFQPASIDNLPDEWELGVEYKDVTINGDLTIKDTTRPVSFNGSVVLTEEQLEADFQATVAHEEFDVFIPDLPFLANVGKDTTLKVMAVAKPVN